VYILLISAFFPDNKGLVLFGIYMTGILMAIILSLLMKKLVFHKQEVPFVMELPPYRIPTLKSTGRHMWHKAYQYLKKMGSVILAASIIVWALGYFPRDFDNSSEYDSKIEQISSIPNILQKEKDEMISDIEAEKNAIRLENSYIGRLGHFISPVMQPLGFDWKMGVSIISGLPAKEIVVSTMSVLYQARESDDNESLIAGIKSETHKSGEKAGTNVFNPVVALAFMVFILIYFPCVATIVAIGKESGWGWALFSLFYTTALAWIMAFIVYNAGNIITNL
jgi:ferrous iron transport protein B